MKSTANIFSLSQVVLCVVTIVAISSNWTYWWIPAVPWLFLSIFGVILTMPLFFLIGTFAAPAQADGIPDGVAETIMFVIPTIRAVCVNYCLAALIRRTIARNTAEPVTQDATGDEVSDRTPPGDSL